MTVSRYALALAAGLALAGAANVTGAMADDFQPLADWRATAGYRQLVAKNLLTRFYLETTGTSTELRRFEEVA